jgi:sulfur-oxidizing protein SoxX
MALTSASALASDRPSTAERGDAQRGRAIVADRRLGLCLQCHRAPIAEERFQGDLGPDLAGVGTRWTPAQLHTRIVDARRLNPQTIMPPYGTTEGLQRVGSTWQGRPLLTEQQIDDVVAYLTTLRDDAVTK